MNQIEVVDVLNEVDKFLIEHKKDESARFEPSTKAIELLKKISAVFDDCYVYKQPIGAGGSITIELNIDKHGDNQESSILDDCGSHLHNNP